MESHLELINKFYESFAKKDADGMISCYHDDLRFWDPAFKDLDSEDAKMMWRMLLERGQDIEIIHKNAWAEGAKGGVNWEAKYTFSKTGRNVHNKIQATFRFQDGLIIEHIDKFNFWKWSSMALGLPGVLLGWTPILQHKVTGQVHHFLKQFKEKAAHP